MVIRLQKNSEFVRNNANRSPNKQPKRFPIKKYNTNEIDINPIDHGSARPTISLTGVGNIASETTKSNETNPPM